MATGAVETDAFGAHSDLLCAFLATRIEDFFAQEKGYLQQ